MVDSRLTLRVIALTTRSRVEIVEVALFDRALRRRGGYQALSTGATMVDTVRGNITVVGAGFMGTVIATLYARYGYRVRLTDVASEALKTFRERAKPIAASLVDNGLEPDAILANVEPETDLTKAIKDAFFVHEAIHENLEAKQRLFAKLDEACPSNVTLGTNTSSYRLSEICRDVRQRDRVIGIHYITPAHIVKLVELIIAEFTPKTLVEWGLTFLTTIDHVGVVCGEEPGFLVNRLQYALLSEAYRIVEEGIASRDDIDKAMRLSLGPRLALWGPLLTEDLVVSKKTSAPIWDYLYEKTRDEKFRRPIGVTKFVESGRFGAITGEGWYRFDQDYSSIVLSRDAQLKSLLNWLSQNDRLEEFKAS
jgi:3-hydroxybutyryl-CoA dehydrogenase